MMGDHLDVIAAWAEGVAFAGYPEPLSYISGPSAGSAIVPLTGWDAIVGSLLALMLMVIYGTGTVSANGAQVVPDFNPATPGKRFGIVNFDWHGPRVTPPPGDAPRPAATRRCREISSTCRRGSRSFARPTSRPPDCAAT